MSPKILFSRSLSPLKTNITLALLIGLVVGLICGGSTALFLHHKRMQAWDELAQDIHSYVENLFKELNTTVNALQPLTHETSCNRVSRQLTYRAAFNFNVRAFLLVNKGAAWCSSATGAMSRHLSEFAPDLDLHKPLDITLVSGTPIVPEKPIITIWYQNPQDPDSGVFTTLNINITPYLLYTARQRDVTGIAIVAKGKAISTFSAQLINVSNIHNTPIRETNVSGYPITFLIYGTTWTTEDIQLAILVALFSGMAGGLSCFYFLNIRQRASKEILTGIRRDQFFVAYQPVISATTMREEGVEALIRWKHPVYGMIPPDAFIGFAEAQQLIAPLTRHLLSLILRDIDELRQSLPVGAKLGINLAPGHLYSDEFKNDIREFLRYVPMDHFHIVFEITERDMLDEHKALPLFDWLHQQGVQIAIDDFGTGHSALIYLEKFALDYLKIDRGFVKSIGTETVTTPVLDAVLTLAHQLNMTTVAEGVETSEQANWLIEQGVNYLQGYYFSHPLTLKELTEWCDKRSDSQG